MGIFSAPRRSQGHFCSLFRQERGARFIALPPESDAPPVASCSPPRRGLLSATAQTSSLPALYRQKQDDLFPIFFGTEQEGERGELAEDQGRDSSLLAPLNTAQHPHRRGWEMQPGPKFRTGSYIGKQGVKNRWEDRKFPAAGSGPLGPAGPKPEEGMWPRGPAFYVQIKRETPFLPATYQLRAASLQARVVGSRVAVAGDLSPSLYRTRLFLPQHAPAARLLPSFLEEFFLPAFRSRPLFQVREGLNATPPWGKI